MVLVVAPSEVEFSWDGLGPLCSVLVSETNDMATSIEDTLSESVGGDLVLCEG